ncbi:MAG: hypothetical protein MZV70_48780 [Desulfobacterales bacterium]|nr:hypothetical protein [Desulfobacterales bacterium]
MRSSLKMPSPSSFDLHGKTSYAAMACGQPPQLDGSRQNSIAAFPTLLTLMTNTSLLEYLLPAAVSQQTIQPFGGSGG